MLWKEKIVTRKKRRYVLTWSVAPLAQTYCVKTDTAKEMNHVMSGQGNSFLRYEESIDAINVEGVCSEHATSDTRSIISNVNRK